MSFQQAIKLSDLPTEIIDNVAGELIDDDVTALHGANRVLFHKTKYAYAERYFKKVHVFLHPVSFDKLERLTNDMMYAKHIEEITVSTYVLRSREDRQLGTSMYNNFHSLIKTTYT